MDITATLRGLYAALAAPLIAFASPAVLAHPGGLNAAGCHNNRKTGEYHCHGGAAASRAESGVSRMTEADKGRSNTTSSGQTCFVGPRGGTYTITKSGKKNYSGC